MWRLTALLILTMASQLAESADSLALEVLNGEGRVILEFFQPDSTRENEAVFLDRKRVNPVSTDSRTVLAAYYEQVVNGRIDSVVEMMSIPDGSKSRIVSRLRQAPDTFSGYNQLERVVVKYTHHWGPFDVHSVILEGNGLRQDWRELTLCIEGICRLSNYLSYLDSERKLYLEAASYLADYKTRGGYEVVKQASLDSLDSFSVFPIISPKTTKKSHYPFRVYLAPKIVESESIRFEQGCGDVDITDRSYRNVALLFCSLSEQTPTDEFKLSDLGLDIDNRELIPVLRYVKKTEDEFPWLPGIEQVLMPASQYRRFIDDWIGVRFVAKLFSDGNGLVFIKPLLKEGEEAVQVIGLVSSGSDLKVTLEPRSIFGEILASEYAAQFIEDNHL